MVVPFRIWPDHTEIMGSNGFFYGKDSSGGFLELHLIFKNRNIFFKAVKVTRIISSLGIPKTQSIIR
jgi:hypothetical protein